MEKIPVAMYARVSTGKIEQSESTEHQISQLMAHLKSMGEQYYTASELHYIDEAFSGYYTKMEERPAFKQMIEDAKVGKFNMLLLREISRVGRDDEENLRFVNRFRALGVRIKSLHDGFDSDVPGSELGFKVKNMIAQIESERISARVSAGMREKAKKGTWMGSMVPIGYVRDKNTQKLVIDESYAPIIRDIFHMYVFERLGTTKICDILNERGDRTKSGKLFLRSHLRQIIQNPVYIGQVTYGRTRAQLNREYDDSGNLSQKNMKLIKTNDPVVVEDAHQAIIDKLTFCKAQEIMKERGGIIDRRTPRHAKYPLVGIAKCGLCGAGMLTSKALKSKKSRIYLRYYRCGNWHKGGKVACSGISIRADKLEGEIFNRLFKHLQKLDMQRIASKGAAETKRLEDKLMKMGQEKKKLINKQTEIALRSDLFSSDAFANTMNIIKRQIENVTEQSDIIERQLTEIRGKDANVLIMSQLLERMKKTSLNDMLELRAIFQELIEKVIVEDANTVSLILYKYTFK
ncbi:recombinase family protein [Aneurinibacillus uraniidurans]|uniref:recombinase family protein n=1 Tax=Aneurinibacillus uraniidurans TaxID=2966586 RepID=UPI00234AB1E1|nr:recombinase family protein [Aneurinibacillus sp. B1]WCN39480.1 recombinase family protein [Aneurinibacillus sp. B1]